MIKAYFEYDETLVCSCCKDNNGIHYNLHIFHDSEYANEDPEIPVWCSNCEIDVTLVDPNELEEEDE